MIKKLLVATLILLLLVVGIAELLVPSVIVSLAKKELMPLGIDNIDIKLTSSRPHLLKILTNSLEGKGIIEDYQSVINFQRIELQFKNFGPEGGEIDFRGLVKEDELNTYLKNQWGDEIDLVLTDEYVNVNIPVNLLIIQISATFRGNFIVEENNRISYQIDTVSLNIPGFEQQATEFFMNKYRLSFSLDNIPNMQIQNIDVEEGYLIVEGNLER